MTEESIDDVVKIACDKLRDLHAEDVATRIEVAAKLRTIVAVRQTYEESGYPGLRPVRHIWAEESYCTSQLAGRQAALEKLVAKAEKMGISYIFGLEFHFEEKTYSHDTTSKYFTTEVVGDGYA